MEGAVFDYSNCHWRNNALSHQRGAVLILALLIVALVAGLGIKFGGDYQMGLMRAENRWYGAQARAYALSAESAAMYILEQDNDSSFDGPGDPWTYPQTVEVDGGTLTLTITDATGQLDLNLIAQKITNDRVAINSPERFSPVQRMFIRLLLIPKDPQLNQADAELIVEAIKDWADDDDIGGFEGNYYASLPDPYAPANRPFRSVEELALVGGMTPELMRWVRPYITLMDVPADMNVNAFDPVLFRCLGAKNSLNPVQEAQVVSILPAPDEPFKNINDFKIKVSSLGDVEGAFAVATNLFWLRTDAELGDTHRSMRSLIRREPPKQFKVLRREDVY
jgi:general secretion pathway protein K